MNKQKYIISLTEFMSIILVYSSVLVSYHFFYLIKYSDFLSRALSYYNNSLIIIVLSFMTILFSHQTGIKSKWLLRYLTVLLVSVIILFINAMARYPRQGIFMSMRTAGIFYVVILSVPIFWIFIARGAGRFFGFINIVSTVWNVLVIIQNHVYSVSGEFIFDFESFFDAYGIGIRNDSIRLSIGLYGFFTVIYNFYQYYVEKKNTVKYIHLLCLLIHLYSCIVCSQSRALEFILAVCIMTMIILGSNTIKTKVIEISSICVALFVLLATDLVQNYLNSFLVNGHIDYSTKARLYAVDYYINCFFSNVLFGNGLAYTGNGSYYSEVEHGARGWAYYSDVGIFGLIANVGLFAIIIYLIPVARMGWILKKIHSKYSISEMVFPTTIFVYIIITSLTLIMTDVMRVQLFALMIGYFEYIYWAYYVKDNKAVNVFK